MRQQEEKNLGTLEGARRRNVKMRNRERRSEGARKI